jgi:hypothetical protein
MHPTSRRKNVFHLFTDLVPPAKLLEGVKCTIANSGSKADAGGTRTGDDLKTKKALLEVRCPRCKKWVGTVYRVIRRSGKRTAR